MKSTQHNIGEGGGELKGIIKVVDREVVLARKDGTGGVKFGEGVVGVDGMKLFLCKNGSKGIDEEVHIPAIVPKPIGLGLDKREKLLEEGHLPYLIEGDESQRCKSIGLRWCWGRRVAGGNGTMCLCFDCSQLACCRSGKVVAQRIVVE